MGKSDKKKKKLRFNPPPMTLPQQFELKEDPTDDAATTQNDDGIYRIDLSKIDKTPIFASETSDKEDGVFLFALNADDMVRAMTGEIDEEDNEDDSETHDKTWVTKCRLMKAYNEALSSINESVTYDAASKMDTIDVRNAVRKLSADKNMQDDYRKFITSKDAFYSYIPCFTTGIIRFAKIALLKWEIIDLDIEEETYTVKIHVFSMHENNPDTLWLNSCMTTKITVTDFDDKTTLPRAILSTKMKHVCHVDQLSRALNLNAVGFNEQDQKFWKNNVRRFADLLIRRFADEHKFMFVDTLHIFLRSITAANYFMSLIPARIPPEHRTTSRKPSAKTTTEKKPPERTLRIVDCMPIISTTMPRCPTRKTVAQYRVASWQTRGHIRRYKSGKTVYIKPSIHHRKNLKSADHTRPQQIIYIRDNTDDETSDAKDTP